MTQHDFDIASLAAYLHLTPQQVEKMISRDQIPGRRVGGEWVFSANEIHHWLEERIGASTADELVEVETILDTSTTAPVRRLSDLVTPTAIFLPLAARTRNSVVERICSAAADVGLMWEAGRFADAIRARESLHPTALENGVALLHPRRPMTACLADPFLALGITSSGIPFGGPRGVLTDVFFLIGSVDEGEHLRTLARLSRALSLPDFLESLRAAGSADVAWQVIQDADRALDDE